MKNDIDMQNEIEKITKQREFQEMVILSLDRTVFANLDDMLSRHFIGEKDIWSPFGFACAINNELKYLLNDIEQAQAEERTKDLSILYNRLEETVNICSGISDIINKRLSDRPNEIGDDLNMLMRTTNDILRNIQRCM